MEFARKQLEKYGWKEGEGLGKNKKGIAKALKPKLKFDTGGLGHDLFSDIHNTWWQRVYDEAAKNIGKPLGNSEPEEELKTKKKKSKKRKEKEYHGFVKTSQLDNSVETKILKVDDDELKEPEAKKEKIAICELTDEELFKACGGRTAHKGARHGLKMNAKLARLEQQESDFSVLSAREDSKDLKKNKKHKKKR